jgi:hypothetical protein
MDQVVSTAIPEVYTRRTSTVEHCCSTIFHALWVLRNDASDVSPTKVRTHRRLLKYHIKAIQRAAVDSETDDELIHELDVVASALLI